MYEHTNSSRDLSEESVLDSEASLLRAQTFCDAVSSMGILLDSLDYSAQELFLLLFKVSPNLLMHLRALVACPGVKLLADLPVWVVLFLK